MVASIALAWCLTSSCSFLDGTSPRGPDKEPPGRGTPSGFAYLGGTGTYDHGCATFEVTVAGANTITVSTVAGSTCGPIQPVVSGTSSWNVVTRKVQLSVALKNLGTNTYLPPATLLGWPDSLQQVTPPPVVPLAMTFTNPDSTNPDTAAVYPSTRLWRYDTLLVSSATLLQRLDPGNTSRARPIEITLGAGLTQFRVVFHAEAQLVDFTVPAVTPDSIPAEVVRAIYASANIVATDSAMSGRYPRNVVTVIFRPGASAADRQAAIASINGEVLGGLRLTTEGVYYVRVRDNGSTAPLHAAWRSLRAHPAVLLASPDLMSSSPSWAAPNDGNGWKTGDWELRTASATGERLAQEAVALPMAWGCEKGDSLLRIAVIDQGFYNGADLGNNLAPSSLSMLAKNPRSHGTSVASLLAAEANNGVGMAGAMWRARLEYYDFSRDALLASDSLQSDWNRISKGILAAGRSGVKIINVSAAINWLGFYNRRPSPGHPQYTDDTTHRASVAELMKWTLRDLQDSGYRPLVVVSAGNDSLDAWWSGIAEMKVVDPSRVVVVGGSKNADPTLGPWRKTGPSGGAFSSNYGSLVDIAAVGGGVHALDKNGSVQGPLFGNSFAAPVIAGIAGLLLSANPTLTADSLKTLILAGAQRDPRVPVGQLGGAKIANAYESLRAAAERTGGPLCGNRVWTTGTELWVQRDSAPDERLVNDTTAIGYLSTFHGGRRVSFRETGAWKLRVAVFNGSAWSLGSPIASDSVLNVPFISGAYHSLLAYSHNADFAAYAEVDASNFKAYTIKHVDTENGNSISLGSFTRSPSAYPVCLWSDNLVCQETVDLAGSAFMQDGPYPAVAYHPMGDSVLVAAPWVRFEWQDSTNVQCGWSQDPRFVCHNHRYRLIVDSTTVYRLKNVAGATKVRLWSQPGLITHLAVSENGEGNVMSESMLSASNVVQRTSVYGETTLQIVRANCKTQFRRNYTTTAQKEIPNPVCPDLTHSRYQGLFAPRRQDFGRPIVIP